MRNRLCAALSFVALLFSSIPAAHAQNTSAPANSRAPAQDSTKNPSPAPEQSPDQWSSSSQQPAALSANLNPYSQPLAPARASMQSDCNCTFHAPWSAEEYYGLLSRMSIGVGVGPLGLGIKGTVILTPVIDGRLIGNFFNYNSANYDVDSVAAHGNIHFASLAAMGDFYPKNGNFRISGGLMLWNGNQVSGTGTQAPGTSFTLNGQTYYSAKANPAAGTEPVSASGVLGLHTNEPAIILSGGFGHFVPRLQRHWSFPSEFGVVFMGAPTLNITPSGWVCTNAALTNCSNVANTSTPVGAEFHASLQSALARWRRSLGDVTIYPIFSYGVVYSFNLKGR